VTAADERVSNYPTVMQSIRGRLAAANDSLSQIEQNREALDNWKHLDFIALQVRKVCELIMLGSSLAHLDEGEAPINAKKWRPKDSFAELAKVNQNPMPVPVRPQWSVQTDGSKQVVPASKPIPFDILSVIYGHCGDLLHVPSAAKVLNEAITPFDVRKFRGWVNGLAQLMSAHMLMLPAIKRVIICRWFGSEEDLEMVMIEGEGAAVFDMGNLPDFSMVKV
jgi:hypothetical protein